MSELVVLGFDGIDEADKVLDKLRELEREYLIDLEDAVVAVRSSDGKVKLKQSFNPAFAGVASGTLSGAMWGTLVGLLLLNPLAGFALGSAVGAGSGALAGSLVDYGINDEFMRTLAGTIPKGSSALFILVRKAQPDKVLDHFSGVKARILRTSLAPNQEKRLQEKLQPGTPSAETQANPWNPGSTV